MTKAKSSLLGLSVFDSSTKKSARSETRQDDRYFVSNDTTDDRQAHSDDSSSGASTVASSHTNDDDVDINQLTMELKEQVTAVDEKEEEVEKWRQILEAQRQNIDNNIKTWQAALADATREHKQQCEDAMKLREKDLADATAKRDARYNEEAKMWRQLLDVASSPEEFEQLKQDWERLEVSRHAPTQDMKQASERLRQLQESFDKPSKAMREAKRMTEELIQVRYAPSKKDVTLTKKEKKYVENVIKWQDTLNEATAKHQEDCEKWEQALKESKKSKGMKRVRGMLRRLIATRDVPSADMVEAIQMLQKLEEAEGAHTMVMKYAERKVCKLEKELMSCRDDITETKKLIGDAVGLSDVPNSFDNSSLGEESAVSQEESGDWLGFTLNKWFPQGMFGNAEVESSVTS